MIRSHTRKAIVTLAATLALTTTSVTAAAARDTAERPTGPAAADKAAATLAFGGTVTHATLNYYDTGNRDAARCWDHFAPGSPMGLPTAQSYRNCNGRTVTVHFGYYYNGSFTEEVGCTSVPDGATVLILRGSTRVGADYGTWVC